jgi:hypothetical protein
VRILAGFFGGIFWWNWGGIGWIFWWNWVDFLVESGWNWGGIGDFIFILYGFLVDFEGINIK